MEKKHGSENREREKQVFLRVNDEEKAMIEARAKRAGLTVAGYLRAVIFGADTPQPRAARRPTVENETLARILGELGKSGSNLNQIARRVNQNQGLDAPAFAGLVAEIRAAVRALMEALGRDAPE
jgi:hypothetical protein